MQPILNQLRSFEVVVLVRIDEALRAIDGRVRGRLRKLNHSKKARPVARKSARRRHANGAAAAAA
jgi:hypothetical protein